MPPLSYAEIRKQQKERGLDHLSSAEFSGLMNKVTGTNDYSAGLGGGLGKFVKGASYGLDQALTPFSEGAGNIGALFLGEKGGEAFKALPRMTVEMAPFMKATKLATVGGASLMAANTYEKTNDLGATAVAGGMGLALPALSRFGADALTSRGAQRLAMQGEKALVVDGLKREVLSGEAAKFALQRSAMGVAKGGVPSALNLGFGFSQGQRMGQMLGHQAGLFGANVVTQAIQGGYQGGAQGFFDALSPERLAVSAITQLPFVAAGTPRALFGDNRGQAAAASYAQTSVKYNPDIYTHPIPDPIHDYILQSSQAASKKVATIAPTNKGTVTASQEPRPANFVDPAFPKQGVLDVNSEKWTVYGSPEKAGEGTFMAGSIPWLRLKTGVQNVVFPNRATAIGFVKANSIDLAHYEIHNVPGENHVVAKLSAKPEVTPAEQKATGGTVPSFFGPMRQELDPQLELSLQPAADAVKATTSELAPPAPPARPNPPPSELDIMTWAAGPQRAGSTDQLLSVAKSLRARGQSQNDVWTTMLHEFPGNKSEEIQAALDASRPETVQTNKETSVPLDSPLDETGNPTLSESPPAPTTNEAVVQQTSLETKMSLINHSDPLVSIPASITLSESGPAILAKEIKAREELPIEDAVEEAVEVVKAKAKAVVVKRGVAEANIARGIKNNENLTTWWDSVKKTLPPEVLKVYDSFAARNTENIKSRRFQNDMLSAVRRWYLGTTKVAVKAGGVPMLNGPEGLSKLLNSIKFDASKPQRVEAAIVIGIDSQGNPILKPEGAGRTARLSFESRNAARTAVDGFKAKDPLSNWSVVAQGHKFVIQQDLLEKPSLAVNEATMEAAFMPEVRDSLPEPAKKLTEVRSPLAERAIKARAEVVGKTAHDYVLQMHENPDGLAELDSLGRLDSESETFTMGDREVSATELGAARLEYALNAYHEGIDMTVYFRQLLKAKDLFSDSIDVKVERDGTLTYDANAQVMDFIRAASPHLAALMKTRVKLLGARDYNGRTETISLEGERVLLPELLRQVGLDDPAFVDVASKLANLYDNQHLAWARLTNPEQAGAAGAFSVLREGERAVWLAAQGTPEATLFTLSHELNGHGLLDLYQQGKLDNHTSERIRVFTEFVKNNVDQNPHANTLILRELLGNLPKNYRENEQLKALMERPEGDVEEVLANVQALLALHTVTAPKTLWNDFMTHLPAPLVNMIAVIGKYGRKFMSSINGLLFNREALGQLDPAARKQVDTYVEAMTHILKVNEKNAAFLKQAMKMQVTNEPQRFGLTIMRPEGVDSMMGHGEGQATRDVAKFLSLDKLKEKLLAPYKKSSTFWDRFLALGPQLGQKFPEMRYVTSRAVAREAEFNKIEFDMLRMYNMVKKGVHWVADPKSAITIVAGSEKLSSVRDDIIRAVNKNKHASHLDAINAKDPEVMAHLGKLTLPEQTLVRENLVKFEAVQTKFAEVIRDQRYAKLTHQVTTQLMAYDGTKPFKQAQQEAAQYVEALRAGTFMSTGYKPVDVMLQMGAKNFEDFHQMAMTQRGFVTETRYGKFRARVEFHGKQRSAFISANSEAEFNILKGQYEAGAFGPFKNWIDKTKQGETEFRMNDQVEFLIAMDAQHSNELALALQREGLPLDKVQEIIDNYSFAKDLRNEMALRELSDSNNKIARFDKRRFADGREHLDMLQQQITFVQTVARGLTKSTFKADFDSSMSSPEMRAHPERKLAQQLWDNYSRQDPSIVRKLNKAQYTMFLSFHFLNMLQDGAQPLLGALPSNLVNEGQTYIGAHKTIMKAMLQAGTGKGLNAQEKALLEDRRKSNSGIGMYDDATSNDVLGLIQARRMAKGYEPLSLGATAGKLIAAPFLWGKGLHKAFTDFGSDAALLASYRHYIGKKMSHEDAVQAANQMVTIAMFSGGKAGRSIGIRSGEGVFGQTAASIMTGLQNYALGSIGTLKNWVDRATKSVPGITATEVTQARKALATQLVSTIAQAGLYGLPGVAALTILAEKMFNINARQKIASMFADDDPDTDEVMQQVALHGLLNTMTGYDVASKSAVTGVLGFNSFDGFSMSQLGGPTAQLIENMFTGAQELGKGNVGNALKESVLPNQLKRIVNQAQNDWEFKDKSRRLIDYSTSGDQAVYGLLGLKPNNIARRQELESMKYTASEIDAEDNKQWVLDQAELLLQGEQSQVQANIWTRVQKDDTLSAEALGEFIATKAVEMTTPRDPRESNGASSDLQKVAGVPYQGPSVTEKFQQQNQLMGQMNLPQMPTLKTLRQKQQIDEMRQQDPSLSTKEILQILRQQGKLSLPQLRSQAWRPSQPEY